MDAYPLRNIPDDLWHRVKVRAMTDRISVRDVILAGLRCYAAGGLEALVDEATPTQKRPTAAAAAR
jgi:plasmid stability protein